MNDFNEHMSGDNNRGVLTVSARAPVRHRSSFLALSTAVRPEGGNGLDTVARTALGCGPTSHGSTVTADPRLQGSIDLTRNR
jgi:hypothetical protein